MQSPIKIKYIHMKRKATSLFILLFCAFFQLSNAQTSHPWELGLNIGGSWYKSDVKMKKLGVGAGFTFGQTYCMNKTSPLFWGWRFRYLNANAYGQDYQKSYGIENNFALNGVSDSSLNYYNNGGYVYQNYKSTLDELSLEIKIGANRLREKTRIIAYVFGGAGLTKVVTRMDQLDANNKRYNYNLIDSAGTTGKSDVLSRLNSLYDGNYESLAEGSKNPKWKFMPSLGVGLGYQITPGFSMGFEHKMTWTLNDMIDGQQWTNTNEHTGTNDIYHYSSIWLKFSFGRKVKGNTSTTTNNTNNTNNLTNITPVPAEKPTITITNPSANPYSTTNQSLAFTAKVTDVNSKADISLVVNGSATTSFNYNSGTDVLTYNGTLNPGSNTIVVTATNTVGSATATQTINYSEPAPVVTITSPNASPLNTSTNMATVVASISNIINSSQIGVLVNGVNNTTFTYNSSSHQLTLNTSLVLGSNTVVITATNNAGSDTKSTTIIYSQPVVNATPPPVVTITTPAANPYNTNSNSQVVTGVIQNVTSKGQINASVNGVALTSGAITFNATTGQVSFNVNLIAGANTVVLGATNISGADSKSFTIVYTQPAPQLLPPVITVTNPAINPATVNTNTTTINATITNINTQSQITVTLNGVGVPAFGFTPASSQFTLTSNLIVGANTFVITATNAAGADTKTVTVIYQQPVNTVLPPVVTITAPIVNPFTTATSSFIVKAKIQNITSKGQINATINGAPVASSAITYNATNGLTSFNAPLISGANAIVVGATNVAGADSKTTTIIYNPPAPVVLPPVITVTNPSVTPANSSTSSTSVAATVTNVNSGQINVTVNGTVTTFSYNAATSQLTFTANLIVGANTVTITATNSAGMDVETFTILYSLPVPTVLPPAVTITNPSVNPFNTSVNTATITATVTNVNSSQISVTVNGTPTTTFVYNSASAQLNMTANLIVGANTITIKGTNSAGTDSKTSTIIYTAPAPVVAAPVVTITTPASSPTTSILNMAVINATITNIASSSQLSVTVNGVANNSFTFNPATSLFTMNTSLVTGANTISIKATNAGGTDTKSTTINHTAPAPVTLPPTVTIIAPSTSPFTSGSSSHTVIAKTTNITSSGQISIKINGVATTAFSFIPTAKTINLSAPLIMGTNTIEIKVTNSAGSDSKTIQIIYERGINPISPDTLNTPGNPNPGNPVTPGSGSTGGVQPSITILNPNSNPYTATAPSITLTAKIMNVDGPGNIVVKLNGAVLTGVNYMAKTKMLMAPLSLVAGANTVVIEATNALGTKTETIVINKQ